MAMEILNNTLCISHAELTAGIMTPDALKYYRRNGRITQLQKGGNGRVALFAVKSLPYKYLVETLRRYPELIAYTLTKGTEKF